MKTSPNQSTCDNIHARAKLQEAGTIIYLFYLFNYLSKFSARLSDHAEPVRELAKDKVPFNLGPEHQEAFNLIKKEIAGAPILAYYNPRKQMILQTDASIKGLGACLLQEGKPVYFASLIELWKKIAFGLILVANW